MRIIGEISIYLGKILMFYKNLESNIAYRNFEWKFWSEEDCCDKPWLRDLEKSNCWAKVTKRESLVQSLDQETGARHGWIVFSLKS